MGCGLWVVGYGLWVVGCGLWVMGYGLWVMGYGFYHPSSFFWKLMIFLLVLTTWSVNVLNNVSLM